MAAVEQTTNTPTSAEDTRPHFVTSTAEVAPVDPVFLQPNIVPEVDINYDRWQGDWKRGEALLPEIQHIVREFEKVSQRDYWFSLHTDLNLQTLEEVVEQLTTALIHASNTVYTIGDIYPEQADPEEQPKIFYLEITPWMNQEAQTPIIIKLHQRNFITDFSKPEEVATFGFSDQSQPHLIRLVFQGQEHVVATSEACTTQLAAWMKTITSGKNTQIIWQFVTRIEQDGSHSFWYVPYSQKINKRFLKTIFEDAVELEANSHIRLSDAMPPEMLSLLQSPEEHALQIALEQQFPVENQEGLAAELAIPNSTKELQAHKDLRIKAVIRAALELRFQAALSASAQRSPEAYFEAYNHIGNVWQTYLHDPSATFIYQYWGIDQQFIQTVPLETLKKVTEQQAEELLLKFLRELLAKTNTLQAIPKLALRQALVKSGASITTTSNPSLRISISKALRGIAATPTMHDIPLNASTGLIAQLLEIESDPDIRAIRERLLIDKATIDAALTYGGFRSDSEQKRAAYLNTLQPSKGKQKEIIQPPLSELVAYIQTLATTIGKENPSFNTMNIQALIKLIYQYADDALTALESKADAIAASSQANGMNFSVDQLLEIPPKKKVVPPVAPAAPVKPAKPTPPNKPKETKDQLKSFSDVPKYRL